MLLLLLLVVVLAVVVPVADIAIWVVNLVIVADADAVVVIFVVVVVVVVSGARAVPTVPRLLTCDPQPYKRGWTFGLRKPFVEAVATHSGSSGGI